MQNRSFLGSIPPVTLNLIIINLLMWLATLVLSEKGIDLIRMFGLHYIESEQFNVTQLITYMFLHSPDGLGHVFFNMFTVFMFGRTLEMVWGAKRFLFYYITTGIGAGLIQELTWYIEFHNQFNEIALTYGWETSSQVMDLLITIGASGAGFGILLGFGMLFPNAQLFLLFIPFPVKAKYLVFFYGLAELFFGVTSSGSSIAHFAHLGGMLFGFILILYWKKKGVNGGGFRW